MATVGLVKDPANVLSSQASSLDLYGCDSAFI